MGYRPLELVIQSAQGLKYVNHFKKMKPYALVFICDNNNNLISYEAKTVVDKDGGSNPIWNSHVKFNNIDIAKAQQNRHALVVKLKSHHRVRSDKDIGEVRVLITELLEGFGEDAEKHVSKSVVTSDGTVEGTLAFLYKFGRISEHPIADQPSQVQQGLPNNNVASELAGSFASGVTEGSGSVLGEGLVNQGTTTSTSMFVSDQADPYEDDEDEYS